jgi:hypothetical protein
LTNALSKHVILERKEVASCTFVIKDERGEEEGRDFLEAESASAGVVPAFDRDPLFHRRAVGFEQQLCVMRPDQRVATTCADVFTTAT